MLTLVLSVLISTAVAQANPRAEAPVVHERTVAEQHDFGEVIEGTESTATFTVTNPTQLAVAITAPDLPAGMRVVLPEGTVAPGESATVTVILTGERSVDGDVVFHAGTHRKVIRIKGNVKAVPVSGAPVQSAGPHRP